MWDTTFCAVVSLSAAKFCQLLLCRQTKLKSFTKTGRVASIMLYPIKSGAPVHLDTAECTTAGLAFNDVTDRTWMVIRSNGSFVSGRREPKLVLIKSNLTEDSICLAAPGMTDLILPKCPEITRSSKFIRCRVWDEDVTGLHCGEEADMWIRQYLDKLDVSLVVFAPAIEKRMLPHKTTGNPVIAGDTSHFADWGPYLIVSESSLDDLNSRLERKVTMANFRPNITIEGCSPFDEDNWSEMRIGNEVYVRMLDLCSRCVFTTVDPSKGEKDLEGQPLKTLQSYRYNKEYDNACFGVNAAVDVPGKIQVGDPVYVIRHKI